MSFKKAIYAVGMGLLLTGCAAQDEPIPGTGEENQGGTGRYVNLSIVTDGSTRADGDATDSKFADGTNGESDVKKIALYFFNESKTCIFKKLIDASKINFAAPSPAEGSVELVGNVEVELTANGDYHYVVAVVNPNSGLYTDDKKTTLKEIANRAALQAERGAFS